MSTNDWPDELPTIEFAAFVDGWPVSGGECWHDTLVDAGRCITSRLVHDGMVRRSGLLVDIEEMITFEGFRELIGGDPRIIQRSGIDHVIEPPQEGRDRRHGPEIS